MQFIFALFPRPACVLRKAGKYIIRALLYKKQGFPIREIPAVLLTIYLLHYSKYR